MQKRKEMGNLFSRSNPKPKKKNGEEGAIKGAKSEGDLLHSNSSKNIDPALKNARARVSSSPKNHWKSLVFGIILAIFDVSQGHSI